MVWPEMVGHDWVSSHRRGQGEEEKRRRKKSGVRGEGEEEEKKKKRKKPGACVREKLSVLFSF